MYDTPDQFPTGPLAPGTHLLGASPPMLGLGRLADEYVARGLETGDRCVVVTTDRDPQSVVDALADCSAGGFTRLGIVDATSQDPNGESLPCRLESVNSPADLTGIAIGLDKHFESLQPEDGEGDRVLVDSVSSLVVYAGFERVYQFLHAVTNRTSQLDGTSVSLFSTDTDRMEMRKLETLFDGTVELRDAAGTLEYRARGYDDSDGWRSLHLGDSPRTDAAESSSIAEADERR